MVKRIAKGTTLMNVSSGTDIIKVTNALRELGAIEG
jgi:hypothetical protein